MKKTGIGDYMKDIDESWRGTSIMDAKHNIDRYLDNLPQTLSVVVSIDPYERKKLCDHHIYQDMINALAANDLANAGDELFDVILMELIKNGFHPDSRPRVDAISLYAKTGSLWYAEFVANSVELLMNDKDQYDMLIAPLLNDDELLDTIPDESYIRRSYSKQRYENDRLIFPLNNYAKNKAMNAYSFYSRITKYTDKPLEYIHRLGFPNIAVLIDNMYAFPYRNTSTSKKDMLEVGAQSYEYSGRAFRWFLDFMSMARKSKDFKLGADKTIDLDWVKSNMDYSTEFLHESLPILDDGLIDDDEYIEKAKKLIERIHNQQCTLKNPHDAMSCDNNVVASFCSLLGFHYDALSGYSPKQRWNLYNVVMNNLLSIPDDLWSLLIPRNDLYIRTFIFPCIYLWRSLDTPLSKQISYFSTSMFSHTDIDKIYRNIIMTDMQVISYDNDYDPKNDFQETLYGAEQHGRPKEIMKYINKGIVSKEFTFEIDSYGDRCTIIQDNNSKHALMNDKQGKKHQMNYHIMDIMNELPKTYQEFIDQSKEHGMTGSEYLHHVIEKHEI